MITTKQELKRVRTIERKLYLGEEKNLFRNMVLCFTHEPVYEIWKYVHTLRKCEYLKNSADKKECSYILKVYYKVCLAFCRRRLYARGGAYGIFISENCFDEGLLLYHGNVVVNSLTRVGKNCRIHGNNCIGNNGKNNKTPILGDNIDIGFGAGIYGDVKLAEGIKIGANAVVLKSWEEPNVTLVGIPAKKTEK